MSRKTARLDEIASLRMGPTILGKELTSSGLPVYSAGQECVPWGRTTKAVPILKRGTIVVSARGSIGFPKLPPEEEFTSTQTTIAVSPLEVVESRYLAYWLSTLKWSDLGSGGAIPMLTIRKLGAQMFEYPELSEQKRIADRLDRLLAAVETCKARLDAIPTTLRLFRQSVLAAATSGRLTEDWRQSASASLESWRTVQFQDVCKEITVGYVGKMSTEYQERGVPFLRSLNVRPFRFNPEQLKYISPEFHRQIKKSALTSGDVAVVRSGAPGQCCVIPAEIKEANCSDLVIVRPGPALLSDYACLYINSEVSQQFVRAEQVGVAQAHFNVGSMKIAPLRLPPVSEQHEIVRVVHVMLSAADAVQATVRRVTACCDSLRQSILASSFRGELGPHDPTDKAADSLLVRTRAMSHAIQSSVPRVRIIPQSGMQHTAAKISERGSRMVRASKNSKAAVRTLDAFVKVLDELGELEAAQFLKIAGLEEDPEAFFELLRQARDANLLDIPVGTPGLISRRKHAAG